MVKSKPRMGKQKIEMKRIQDEVRRQVCFSKRRSGVFKKANELSILCGAEVAIVVFSPGGNPYSFGHPSVSSVINHFLLDGICGNPTISNNGQGSSGATSTLHELIWEHAKLEKMIEAEKCRGKKIQEAIEKEIQEMELDELEKLKEELVGQHDMINTKKIQLMKERAIKAFQDAVMGIYGPPQFPLGSQGASQLGVNPTPDSGTSGAGAFGHGLNGNFAM